MTHQSDRRVNVAPTPCDSRILTLRPTIDESRPFRLSRNYRPQSQPAQMVSLPLNMAGEAAPIAFYGFGPGGRQLSEVYMTG